MQNLHSSLLQAHQAEERQRIETRSLGLMGRGARPPILMHELRELFCGAKAWLVLLWRISIDGILGLGI